MKPDRRIPFITSAGVPVDPRNIIISGVDANGNVDLTVAVITGSIDCSGNPNYPSSNAGALYLVIVGGKIGGASGLTVVAGDLILCTVTNAGGTQAQVGADFDIVHSSLTAAQLAALVHAAASKDPPVDNDELALVDSAASFGLKKLTWANLKAAIVALFPVKATFTEVNTGTDDAKFITPLALAGSDYARRSDTINAQTGTTYTLDPTDHGKVVTFSNAASIAVTVPAALGAGFNCLCIQIGAGAVTFTASGSTLSNSASHNSINGQYGVASIVAYAANLLVLGGDTKTI